MDTKLHYFSLLCHVHNGYTLRPFVHWRSLEIFKMALRVLAICLLSIPTRPTDLPQPKNQNQRTRNTLRTRHSPIPVCSSQTSPTLKDPACHSPQLQIGRHHQPQAADQMCQNLQVDQRQHQQLPKQSTGPLVLALRSSFKLTATGTAQ